MVPDFGLESHLEPFANQKVLGSLVSRKLPIQFVSDAHARCPLGADVNGQSFCEGLYRRVEIMENVKGHSGYSLEPGDGYLVTVYTEDGHQQIGTKPMRIVSADNTHLELRGYPAWAQGPFGPIFLEELRDFGASVLFDSEGEVERCILHRYDTHIEYVYASVSSMIDKTAAECMKLITIEDSNKAPEKPYDFSAFEILLQGDKAKLPDVLSRDRHLSPAQESLSKFTEILRGPARLAAFKNSSKPDILAECLIQMLIDDIPDNESGRSVCAEAALLCLFRYLIEASQNDDDDAVVAGHLDLFYLYHHGKEYLQPLFDHIAPDAFDKALFLSAAHINDALASHPAILPRELRNLHDRILLRSRDRGWSEDTDFFGPVADVARGINSTMTEKLTDNNQ